MLWRESLSGLRKSKYETKEQQIRNLFAAANTKFVRRPCSKGRKGLTGKRGDPTPWGHQGQFIRWLVLSCLVLSAKSSRVLISKPHTPTLPLSKRATYMYTRSTKVHTTLYKTLTSQTSIAYKQAKLSTPKSIEPCCSDQMFIYSFTPCKLRCLTIHWFFRSAFHPKIQILFRAFTEKAPVET